MDIAKISKVKAINAEGGKFCWGGRNRVMAL